MVRNLVLALAGLVVLAFFLGQAAGRGAFGEHEGPGQPNATPRSAELVSARSAAQAEAAESVGARGGKQILFGDLHVHTTFSFDAYMFSLPLLGGEGAHPPADACDFARYCSALDFWSINDHAENLTPLHWQETVQSIRACNAVSGEGPNPDTVAFLGWEWTQVGTTPENHYGHKNVVLAHTDDDRIPTRPIGADRPEGADFADPPVMRRGIAALALGGRFHDYNRFVRESEATARCAPDVDVHDLPDDCIELARTPADLYRKLDEWGFDSIVIPHGTTWGMYSPPATSWDKQLVGDMHDPARQKLIEVYSGHGDSERYSDFRAVVFDRDGNPVCPEPTPNYLPSCWRAGEIIRERCQATGEDAAECEDRAATARANYAKAGLPGHLTVPGVTAEEWLDSGQCRECDQPAFNYRPAGSAQYILALGNFDSGREKPRHFRLGFMASSDNHFARPGTGYKEVHRSGMTESLNAGAASESPLAASLLAPKTEPTPYSVPFDRSESDLSGFALFETERQASFFTTGGLIAVHAEGRGRDAIWDAMQRREVYGTTGPRILLWFDLLNPPGSRGHVAPMGSEVAMDESPIFQARAVGSFEQEPGCPDDATAALGAGEIERLCKGECYHPGDRRRAIARIEVVKITPQVEAGEEIAPLIADPWRVFACDPGPEGCAVTFADPAYAAGDRDSVYYVRAYEEPTPGINADNLRCSGKDGACEEVSPCPGPDGAADDCLAPYEPRAWSSPIWVDRAASAGAAATNVASRAHGR